MTGNTRSATSLSPEVRATLPKESESPWIASCRFPSFPRLRTPPAVDVVVVGAGITGLTCAALLKQAGKRVAVVDASRVAEGVTGGTSAHLTEVPDCTYRKLLAHFGEKDGRRAAAASRAAIDTIASFVHTRRIECGFHRVPGYYYTERAEQVEEVRQELEAARALGVEPVPTRDVPLPFQVEAALRFDGQARFHVREYLLPLLESIPGDGSFVFENTRVTEVHDGAPCVVETETGEITAADVVMATHVPLNRLLLQTKVAHYRIDTTTLGQDN